MLRRRIKLDPVEQTRLKQDGWLFSADLTDITRNDNKKIGPHWFKTRKRWGRWLKEVLIKGSWITE